MRRACTQRITNDVKGLRYTRIPQYSEVLNSRLSMKSIQGTQTSAWGWKTSTHTDLGSPENPIHSVYQASRGLAYSILDVVFG